jgi:hypothetical protein
LSACFDTADLKDAKALLGAPSASLAARVPVLQKIEPGLEHFRGSKTAKYRRWQDWLRAGNRAMCVSSERSDVRPKGGPRMGFEHDFTGENQAGARP